MNPGDTARLPTPFDVSPSNLPWVEDLFVSWQHDPGSVDEGWRRAFEAWATGQPAALPGDDPAPRPVDAVVSSIGSAATREATAIAVVAAERALGGKRIRKLIEDLRELGHLSVDLDPLGIVDRSRARLRPADYGLNDSDLDTIVNADDIPGTEGRPRLLREIIAHLEETYCRHIGVELSHIHDSELRTWLMTRCESTRNRVRFTRAEQLRLLSKVIDAEVFEQFLQTKFLGYKRFSCEGAESVIPLMDRVIERAASQGVSQIVIGMAHRGRLNVLSNVMAKPPTEIFAEFLDRSSTPGGEGGGDVKYHMGYSTDRVTAGGGRVHLSLAFNPSHLEIVNPVVQGRTRAKQDRLADVDRSRGLSLLLHGDAAFAGQGIIAEGFNMSGLDAYSVGGTIHIVLNNQIGFTTGPQLAYCGGYCTDVARMLQIPIFHINGEDPEAIAQAVDLAVDFRQRFRRDVVIDMWSYRKLGHNEGDEPSYTQPLMYRAIARKGSVRAAYLDAFSRATAAGEQPLNVADAEAVATERHRQLDEGLDTAKNMSAPLRPSTMAGVWSAIHGGPEARVDVATAVPSEALLKVAQAMATVPPGFTPHPKLVKELERRAAMGLGKEPLNWGMGEALAYGTLLLEGVRIRFSGQDVRRGTFSHRHATLFDYATGAEYTSLQYVSAGQAPFEIHDSCLSEAGVLGFEYGYSLDMPDALVVWEAQFGDFVNNAQVIIDQFLVSSETKWRRVSGLVLLLPHGMEGQGPEHSSARLERFLNLCATDNMQVCNVTTPAQIFHLLRRQVLRPYRKPLVVMSPKSLLRHPVAVSSMEDLSSGGFQHVIADSTADPALVDRVLLCSGKVYFDLVAARSAVNAVNVAIIRVEQLYPLRREEILEAVADYREGSPVIWVQEEARNMGAWNFMSRHLPGFLAGFFRLSCVSRPFSASPATGSSSRHDLEHARLLEESLGVAAGSVTVSKGQIKATVKI